MRTRTENSDITQGSSLARVFSLPGNTQTATGAFTKYLSFATARKTVDEVTPRFRLRRARGEIIMNPYTSITSTLINNAYDLEYTSNKYRNSDGVLVGENRVSTDGGWTSRNRIPRTLMANMDSTALAAELALYGMGSVDSKKQIALAKALDQASSSDALALVTLAEWDKTVDLFKNGVGLANKSVRLLESLPSSTRHALDSFLSKWGRARSRTARLQLLASSASSGLSSIASAWLGYRYGIMATYYDLQSWVAATKTKNRARFVAAEFDSYDSPGAWSVDSTSNYSIYRVKTSRARRSQIKAGVLVDSKALNGADRFGAGRLLSTAWELTPFSFVVDWFADVGTRLSAWEGGLFVRPLGSWISVEHRFQFQGSLSAEFRTVNDGTYTYVGTGTDSAEVTEVTTMRERFANPNLSVLPQVDVNLNWRRLADSAALATQLSRRLRSVLG